MLFEKKGVGELLIDPNLLATVPPGFHPHAHQQFIHWRSHSLLGSSGNAWVMNT